MNKKTLSVLLPNFNNGLYLKEALDSLFAQTMTDFEIFFVDDCSSDNSVEIAKSYQDDRLKIIVKESNSGIVDALNIGLDLIESDYFIRMDGDDISTPDRFELLVRFMDNNPTIGVCSSDIMTFGKYEQLISYGRDPQLNKANLIFGHSIGHASSIFRTSVFKKNNIRYQNRFWRMEDYYLFYQLKDVTETISISSVFYYYRRGYYNDNPEINQRKEQEFINFYQMILEDLGLDPTPKDLLMHLQLNNRQVPTCTPMEYERYLNRIQEQNRKVKKFPIVELEQVMNRYLQTLVYRMIDQNLTSFKQLFPYLSKNKQLAIYYLKIKTKRLIGR